MRVLLPLPDRGFDTSAWRLGRYYRAYPAYPAYGTCC